MPLLFSRPPSASRHHLVMLALAAALLLPGCTGNAFRPVATPAAERAESGTGPATASTPARSLGEWGYKEYWTGIVFNGNKIGFTHLSLSPVTDAPGHFDVASEANLRFHFLTLDKRVVLKSLERVNSDLTTERFSYDYELDGNTMRVMGEVEGDQLRVTLENQGAATEQFYPLKGKVYTSSAIALYPVLNGLEVGRRYEYEVFDGETRSLLPVVQEVLGYEESELFDGHAFKVRTLVQGQEVTTWFGEDGRPKLEISFNGVFVAGLEEERTALTFLTEGALNKGEAMLDFSLVRTAIHIAEPEFVNHLEVALSVAGGPAELPSDEWQQCEQLPTETLCRVGFAEGKQGVGEGEGDPRYLLSTFTVPARHAEIEKQARAIVAGRSDREEQIAALLEWIQREIERSATDVFNALDVLRGRKAECQGHAYLYAAFARSLGIPTRLVGGLVYAKGYDGFLYHAWTESLMNGHWVPVDPTFSQFPADATHIKVVEGESATDLLPLARMIGRVKASIRSVEGL